MKILEKAKENMILRENTLSDYACESKEGILLKEAVKKIDGACSKGVIKKNTASRKKSNLAKKLNTLA